MEFLRLEADDYTSAVLCARQQWGSAVRIHSRRDINPGRKDSRCEITFYLVDLTQQQRYKSEQHLLYLLKANGIDASLPAIATLQEGCEHWEESEVEMHLIGALLGNLNYSYGFTERTIVVIGNERRRTAVKLAATLQERLGKRVALLQSTAEPTILEELATLWKIPICRAGSEACEAFEYLITTEEEIADSVNTVASLSPQALIVDPAAALEADMIILRDFHEITLLGPLLGALLESELSLGYIDQEFASDSLLTPASASLFLEKLEGFRIDLHSLLF